MNTKLNRKEQTIRAVMATNYDVSIEYLYGLVFPDKIKADITSRRKQQELGSVICSLNQKLKASGQTVRVVPGLARRSYALRHQA